MNLPNDVARCTASNDFDKLGDGSNIPRMCPLRWDCKRYNALLNQEMSDRTLIMTAPTTDGNCLYYKPMERN